jgi:capsular polysaccharide biosynthesis protein
VAPFKTVGRALRHLHWVIWGMALVGLVGAVGVAKVRHPTYQATTVLSVDESTVLSQGIDVAVQADQYLADRYDSMATSQPVLEQVCREQHLVCNQAGLAALAKRISAAPLKTTGLIGINATAATPEAASQLANQVAQAVIQHNQQLIAQTLAPQRALLQQELASLSQQIAQIQAAIGATNALPATEAATRQAPLLAQLTPLQNQYTSTYTNLQALEVQQSQQDAALSVYQPATPPPSPVDPSTKRYGLVGGAVGLVLGFLLALVGERFRDVVDDAEDLAQATGCRLVLNLGGGRRHWSAGSYGFLTHASLLSQPGSRAILLVAASPRERVDEVAIDLAQAAAGLHHRVLVVPAVSAPSRRIPVGAASEVLVESPSNLNGHPVPDGFDLTIRSALPPMDDPGTAWLRPPSGVAVVVATQGRTRFSDARRTSELLRHVGVEPVAAVLLSPRPPERAAPAPAPAPPAAEPAETVAGGAPGV